ncbi:gamma-glutamyltransferase [Bacillus sp. FJAT-29790]|uniref:gamma-glutamyltransferase n=1 Tax=Bacillus sp. FJAT-29790 TaxID=1895002 RepID=UPI001C22D699|nr:gamma-glutamyltransferase [Bacillus sp. FJAT-29790]MBU8879134.1 gamma-glutamyltransferase [Bacillus sp. FJAT-29790]
MKYRIFLWLIFLTVLFIVGMVSHSFISSEKESKGPIMYDSDQTRKKKTDSKGLISEKSQGYGVSADNEIAVDIGMAVLKKGGNAVDAAVAVSYALSVVEPYNSGLGGGGSMIIHKEKGKEPIVYDYYSISPLDSIPLSGTGIMGFVKGMEKLNQDLGTFDLKELIEPSIQLAERGFKAKELSRRLGDASNRIEKIAHFFPNGQAISEGDRVLQKELANTLRIIQKKGSNGFYTGDIAKQIHNKVEEIELSDFRDYKVLKKKPIKSEFDGFDVYSASPPLGGIMLAQSLQMAENLEIGKTLNVDKYIHLMGLINRISYQDRVKHIGDPDFVEMDLEKLVSKEYSQKLASNVSKRHKSPFDSDADFEDHENTTHFVIVDKQGMMVSATNTLSNLFGSGEYVAGFFLNNQLKNFSNNQNSPNRKDGGKRPYSYIAPTILVKDGKAVIGIGSAGGNRITSIITQVLIQYLKYDVPIEEAINNPRFFMEMNKDYIIVEGKLPNKVKRKLKKWGYKVVDGKSSSYFGGVQSLVVDNGVVYGGADSRRQGNWRVQNK